MQWTNTKTQWGGVAQLFHWGMFLLIIGQYSLAYTMINISSSPTKFALYGWHKQLGVTLFLLVFIRLWWREHSKLPQNIDTAPGWTQVLSKLNIWVLYFLLFAFPLSGLLMTILGGYPVNYFNLFTIPALMQGPNEAAKILLTLHRSFSYALYVFVGAHIAGGLFHHFYLKDKVLKGMLPPQPLKIIKKTMRLGEKSGMLLNKTDLALLKEALHYLKMEELKEVCVYLNLPFQGQKRARIERILIFLETGKVSKAEGLPIVSQALKDKNYPLAPETPILSGSYKNDLATRTFLKSLIGDYFHFTAFGQDWIKERWAQGNPPTYKEFAQFWKKEFAARKQRKATPKQEWAYLNFVQKYCREHHNFTRADIIEAWEKYRALQVQRAQEILKRY